MNTDAEKLQNWQTECEKQYRRKHEVFRLNRFERLRDDMRLARIFDDCEDFDKTIYRGGIEIGVGGRTRRRF